MWDRLGASSHTKTFRACSKVVDIEHVCCVSIFLCRDMLPTISGAFSACAVLSMRGFHACLHQRGVALTEVSLQAKGHASHKPRLPSKLSTLYETPVECHDLQLAQIYND